MTTTNPPSGGAGDAAANVHERIARRLADLATADPTHPPHPYIRRYLAEHASHGRALDDRHLPAEFLPWETSGRIRGLLGLPITDTDGTDVLATWAKIEPYLADSDPPARWASLALAHAALTRRRPPTRNRPAAGVGIDVDWARWQVPANIVGIVHGGVSALASFAGLTGAPCWPPAAAMGRCGCGTPPAAPRSVSR